MIFLLAGSERVRAHCFFFSCVCVLLVSIFRGLPCIWTKHTANKLHYSNAITKDSMTIKNGSHIVNGIRLRRSEKKSTRRHRENVLFIEFSSTRFLSVISYLLTFFGGKIATFVLLRRHTFQMHTEENTVASNMDKSAIICQKNYWKR